MDRVGEEVVGKMVESRPSRERGVGAPRAHEVKGEFGVIYGAPSANHEWEMLFQHSHVNGCGLTLSEVEPSLYVKIEVDENDEVSGWMIANVWTDDVRRWSRRSAGKSGWVEAKMEIRWFLLVLTDFSAGLDL